jgi:hypothetical protein
MVMIGLNKKNSLVSRTFRAFSIHFQGFFKALDHIKGFFKAHIKFMGFPRLHMNPV